MTAHTIAAMTAAVVSDGMRCPDAMTSGGGRTVRCIHYRQPGATSRDHPGTPQTAAHPMALDARCTMTARGQKIADAPARSEPNLRDLRWIGDRADPDVRRPLQHRSSLTEIDTAADRAPAVLGCLDGAR